MKRLARPKIDLDARGGNGRKAKKGIVGNKQKTERNGIKEDDILQTRVTLPSETFSCLVLPSFSSPTGLASPKKKKKLRWSSRNEIAKPFEDVKIVELVQS